MVRVEKGWVEHEFVLFIIGHTATWNKVAKLVNILQDTNIILQLQNTSAYFATAIDKLKLAGQNLGGVFNLRHGRAFTPCTSLII